MRSKDDATLVAAARGGDREAFAILVVRHRPLLLALCRRTLGDPDAAEDVVQEALLQALLGLDRLRRAEQFGPWLAGIGLNVCRRLRCRRRDDWSWDAIVGGRRGPEPVDDRSDPAASVEATDVAERVRCAVAALPRGQRAAVALVYLAGLTQAETAEQLGIDVGAVKTRLQKARATLRRRLWATWQEATMAEPETVAVRVADVRRSQSTKHVAVLLEEIGGSRRLPIWIGDAEGTAIALHLEQVAPPRPLTYAFAANVLAAAGGRLREVRIARLDGEVYYAVAVVEGPAGRQEVDARPSDALNLALLADAPIRVAYDVFARVAVSPETEPTTAKAAPATESEGAAEIAAAAVVAWDSWKRSCPTPDPAATDQPA